MVPAIASQTMPIVSPGAATLSGDENMLLVSRWVVYVQGLLFCLVAGVAFAAGFFIGRGQPAPAAVVESRKPKTDPVALRGVVQYGGTSDNMLVDNGAIVVALSKEPPLRKFSPQGLRPEDLAGPTFKEAAAAVHASGGDCVRCDEKGGFHLVVPRPGKYYLLIVSHHAARAANERINADHLKEVGIYFEDVADLIGGQQYRWTLEEFSRTAAPLTHTFMAKK